MPPNNSDLPILLDNLKPIDSALDKIVKPAFRKRGLFSPALYHHWAQILQSPTMARHSCPIKLLKQTTSIRTDSDTEARNITLNVLLIRVEGPWAVEMQHHSKQILERINRFFGYKAVDKLQFSNGPIKRSAPKTTFKL
jgi:hypothetical protein